MRLPAGWLRDGPDDLTRDDERFSIVREGRGRYALFDWGSLDALEHPRTFATRKAALAAAEGEDVEPHIPEPKGGDTVKPKPKPKPRPC
jgi:hypothetical protein